MVRNSLEALRAGTAYDLYVLAREEPGQALDFGDLPKITHSLQTFRHLGFKVDDPYALMHCSDILFGFLQQQIPGYDFYVMVENDVFIRRTEPPYFDRLASKLAHSQDDHYDLIAVKLGFSDPKWLWHPAVAKVYDRVLTTFFPVVALSDRAITHLYEERLKELARLRAAGALDRDGLPADLMFCEAFIASALWGRFNVMELNEFMPGSYVDDDFNTGPPRLLVQQSNEAPPALSHPVVDAHDFLEKMLFFSWRTHALDDFIEKLRTGYWPLSEDLVPAFERKAIEHQSLTPPPS